jgi:hypothetical protein
VFGVLSGEYLSYSQQNQREWEERGEEIVAIIVKLVKTAKVVGDKVIAVQQEIVDEEGQKIDHELRPTTEIDNNSDPLNVPLQGLVEIEDDKDYLVSLDDKY